MPWNLLILPLVAGYYLLTRCNYFKFHQQRLDRQRLIFESVLLGLGIFIFTYTVRFLISLILPFLIPSIYSLFPFKQPYAITSFVTVVIAIFATWVINVFTDDRTWIKKSIEDVGNEFELLMDYSFSKKSLIQFTLDNNKFYIAWVKELPIPSISNYVRVIPAMSGYRNESKEFIFTTHYLSIYAEYIKEGKVKNINDLNTDLIIDITNVISVSNFDSEMHKRFNRVGKK